jgi:hypothetical protein
LNSPSFNIFVHSCSFIIINHSLIKYKQKERQSQVLAVIEQLKRKKGKKEDI